MNQYFARRSALLCCVVLIARFNAVAVEPVETFPLWPGVPPGQSFARGEEKLVEGRPRPFYQITDVSTPTVSVFLPARDKRLGTALMILPGGGLQRLAYETEGLEVADWAVNHGMAAFLVKYRVPAPAVTGAQDGQRALSMIRARAREWNIDSNSIGTIGFSAGGEIEAWMLTHYNSRQYAAVDALDMVSCRPDFVAMIYPGGLTAGYSGAVNASFAGKIPSDCPPVFLAHASDDQAENSLAFAMALKQARVPVEVHIYSEGAHGFATRKSGLPVGSWTDRCEDWLRLLGFLDKPLVRDFARDFSDAVKGAGPLPRFPRAGSLDDAFLAQKRFVRGQKDATIAGFKGAVFTGKSKDGPDRPLTGVLFRSGRLNASDKPVIQIEPAEDTVVETEIGYVIAENIATQVGNDTQARECVERIVPVVELSRDYTRRMGGPLNAKDQVASNLGSDRYIVGKAQNPPVDTDSVKVTLEREGRQLYTAAGADVKGGQWANLRQILNQITGHGTIVRAGSIILCGPLGGTKLAQPGRYLADYGTLGTIEFQLEK